jgi:hypothetical protein
MRMGREHFVFVGLAVAVVVVMHFVVAQHFPLVGDFVVCVDLGCLVEFLVSELWQPFLVCPYSCPEVSTFDLSTP